jgi:hypothetical protein
MNALLLRRVAGICSLLLLLGSCSDESERNIITERSPFFQAAMPYNAADTERIVASVRRFADANGMDFLVSRDGPDPGDYNVTAASRELNLQVMHVRAISPTTTDVHAYMRTTASDADKVKVRQFVCVVKGECKA